MPYSWPRPNLSPSVTDKVSNLTSGVKYITRQDEEGNYNADKWEWEKIVSTTIKSLTEWKFVPAGSQWRVGLSGSFVTGLKLKRTLKHMLSGGTLNDEEFGTFLNKAIYIMNDWLLIAGCQVPLGGGDDA